MRKQKQLTLIQAKCPNHNALQMVKQEAHSAEVGALAPEIEKLATEPKLNLLRCKNVVNCYGTQHAVDNELFLDY